MISRRQAVWGAVAAAAVLATGPFAGDGGFRRYWRLEKDLQSLGERTAKLRAENERLLREARALKHDDAAIERAAREQLGLVRPSEIVFTLEEP